ncbi:carbamoyltransferase [uncultured Croceitalea sp.]|uniref:carbamoyltransferase family protein n=1 Tax=uncultured Croceitalea sp. TaxID=1798908 RepID=UPI00374E697F
MVILGLNYYFHDSSACLVKDGMLLNAIEEERLNRDKHTKKFPRLSAERCLKDAGFNYSDVDYIAISIKPKHNWEKKLIFILSNLLRMIKSRSFLRFISYQLGHPYLKQREFWNWYKEQWKNSSKGPKVYFVEHHLSHVAGSFFVSPYKSAALLGIDGAGEWATTWVGHGRDNEVIKINENFFPHSLGAFYEIVTQFCGFKPNYDEGKTMGLAPMGNPEVYRKEVEKIIKVDKNGSFKMDLSFFNPQYVGYSDKFTKVFGQARKPNEPFEQRHKDVAAAFQKVLEDKVLEICDVLYKKTKEDYLVIAGGVSLNSVMNGRIVRESPFKDVYVMPAAGDNGTALGAAFYLYNSILKNKRIFVHDNPYIGTSYTNNQIRDVLDGAKLEYQYKENICDFASQLLEEGKIIGWFQGAMEVGPRALGSRSILANPAFPDMKDKINSEVKFREAYRPFAPSALKESKNDFFDLEVEAPFMLKVCNVLKEKRTVIPAVTHVDGSARLQTVEREKHPRYYNLIKALGQRTGVPVVLNTSFNIQGEPVVESPKDAIRCFFSTGLDALVIGNFLITKSLK